ncbi:amidohydrolase family protein [Sulfoacidibacillus ferrooxidans]|uniref:Allantoinase n=1 Tax=Sulfoacidibacillus ferrooxidans TaxID=2005001 RepID=A0A9X1VD47_9BACL|nr:amidohydrolase family protein [Sulfoacidibacillus ferrooxidans]MCI0183958.1 Allantoinase [Sulfoacidibacillus ferrooxidans]
MILGEHFDLIIRDAMIIQEHEIVRADLGILNGKIAAIEKNISEPAWEEICASGLYVFPGMIDTHVHCNEPGRTEWEGFSTATRSLAAGGVTTFLICHSIVYHPQLRSLVLTQNKQQHPCLRA